MKKAFTILLGLALFAAIVAYGIALYRIQTQLERVSATLAGVGVFEWGWVWLDPRGRTTIYDLEFRAHGDSDVIRADSLTLRSVNLPRMLEVAPTLNRGSVPATLSVSLHRLRLPITPLIAPVDLQETGLLLPLRAEGCDAFDRPLIHDLLSLDYGQLVIDADFDYRIDRRTLELTQQIRTENLSAMAIRAVITTGEVVERIDQLSELMSQADLQQLDYRFQDLGLVDRMETHCTLTAGLTPAQRTENHFSAWLRFWTDRGLRPGEIVQAGYRHYLAQGASPLSVKARPHTAMPLRTLVNGEPFSFVNALNLQFSIADGPDIDFSLERVRPTAVPVERVEDEPTEEEIELWQTVGTSGTNTIVVGRMPAWELVPLERIATRIGDSARILLLDGSLLSGQIMAVDDEQIALKTRSRQGEFTRPIWKRDIDRIELRP